MICTENVDEWCQDWGGRYASLSVTDIKGPSSGSGRVVRGGSWDSFAAGCRSAKRGAEGPRYRFRYLGFRLVFSSDR